MKERARVLLHQYSQSVSSFKTPYSCKLYEQMMADRSEGVGLDSQSKQSLREVRTVAPTVAAL